MTCVCAAHKFLLLTANRQTESNKYTTNCEDETIFYHHIRLFEQSNGRKLVRFKHPDGKMHPNSERSHASATIELLNFILTQIKRLPCNSWAVDKSVATTLIQFVSFCLTFRSLSFPPDSIVQTFAIPFIPKTVNYRTYYSVLKPVCVSHLFLLLLFFF